jgi:hypothetical protein
MMTSPMKFIHRTCSNSMIRCKLANETSLKRFSGSRRSYGYQRRWFLVIGTTPAACPSGGVCRWPARELYWMRGRWWWTLGWSEAHPDAEELASEVAGGRTREIVGAQSSGCRARRYWLGAFQLDSLDEMHQGTMAELRSCLPRLGDAGSGGAGVHWN